MTAPIVELLEGNDILRDSVLALDEARGIQFATERRTDDINADGELSIELLETTTKGSRFQVLSTEKRLPWSEETFLRAQTV